MYNVCRYVCINQNFLFKFSELIYILQQQKLKSLKLFVQGAATAGKTTFVKKLTNDWATLHDGSNLNPQVSQSLGQFKLVIPIILQLVKPDVSIRETIHDQLHFLTKKDMKVISWVLEEEGKACLLVFDGLDEFDMTTNIEVANLMNGTLHKECHTIITSRPIQEGAFLSLCRGIIYQNVRLDGFSEKNIRMYIKKFFSKNSSLADGLIEKLFSASFTMESVPRFTFKEEAPMAAGFTFRFSSYHDPWRQARQEMTAKEELIDLAKNPGHLGMLCTLWRWKKQIVTSREVLFEEIVKMILSRWEEKIFHVNKTPPESILQAYHETLVKFGVLASSSRDGSHGRVEYMINIFSYEDIVEFVGPNAMQSGFFYKSHPASRLEKCLFSFLHKCIQEYLRAIFITSEAEYILKYAEGFKSLLILHKEMSQLRFVLHCCPDDVLVYKFFHTVLSSLHKESFIDLEVPGDIFWAYTLSLSILCGYIPKKIQNFEPIKRVDHKNNWLTAFDYPTFAFACPESIKHEWALFGGTAGFKMENSHFICTSKFQNLHVYSCNADTSMSSGSSDPTCWVTIKPVGRFYLTGNCSSLKTLEVKDVGRFFINSPCPNLRSIKISSSVKGHTGLLQHILNCSPLCFFIGVRDCPLETSDLPEVDSVGKPNANIGSLKFSPASNFSGGGNKLAYLISQLPQLQNLWMIHCNLRAADIQPLSNYIDLSVRNTAENCTELLLDHNSLKGGMRYLLIIAQCLPKLKKFSANTCELDDEDLKVMKEAFVKKNEETIQESKSEIKKCVVDLSKNLFQDTDILGTLVPLVPKWISELYLSQNGFVLDELMRKTLSTSSVKI